jgi:hypothetical protein
MSSAIQFLHSALFKAWACRGYTAAFFKMMGFLTYHACSDDSTNEICVKTSLEFAVHLWISFVAHMLLTGFVIWHSWSHSLGLVRSTTGIYTSHRDVSCWLQASFSADCKSMRGLVVKLSLRCYYRVLLKPSAGAGVIKRPRSGP